MLHVFVSSLLLPFNYSDSRIEENNRKIPFRKAWRRSWQLIDLNYPKRLIKYACHPFILLPLPQEISFRKLFFSSWNGSSFVNDSNGDSFMASSPPFLLVSCTPSRVCGREVESWGGSDLVAGVKESQREREREREFQGGGGQYYPRWLSLWLIIRPWLSLSLSSSRLPYIPPLFLYRHVHTYKRNVYTSAACVQKYIDILGAHIARVCKIVYRVKRLKASTTVAIFDILIGDGMRN